MRFLLLVRMAFTPEIVRSGVRLIADRDHLYEADQGAVVWSAPQFETAFTPTQTNCTKGVNAPGFVSTGLNKAGVNAPLAPILDLSESTIWYIVKDQDCTDELANSRWVLMIAPKESRLREERTSHRALHPQV